MPFNSAYAGFSTSIVYVGTNNYLTFAAGSDEHSNISATNPSLPKILIQSGDNSVQRVYFGTEGTAPNRTYRVRSEGTNSTSGTPGSPNMVYEAVSMRHILKELMSILEYYPELMELVVHIHLLSLLLMEILVYQIVELV